MKLHPTESSFEDIVLTARPAFSKRSWKYVLGLAVPWLILAGQRCMTRLALLAGPRRSLSAYYRFLSHGKWRLHKLFHCLFDLIIRTVPSPSFYDKVEDRPPLRPQALADGEHPLGEARSIGAVRPERPLAPQHALAYGALGGVVRGLDALDLGEGPSAAPYSRRSLAILRAAGTGLLT